MRWTLKQVADAVAGKSGHGVDAVARVAGVSIDSRTIRRGELFIAIHGPRNDGHDYVAVVMESGALAAVVAGRMVSPSPGSMQRPSITVPDTATPLHQQARTGCQGGGKKTLRGT